MSRKNVFRYRLICLLITLFMLVMGMHVEENHMDSPLAYSVFGSVSFQRVSQGQKTVAYRDNSVLSQLKNLTVFRTPSRMTMGTRAVQWLISFLIPTAFLLGFLIFERTVFFYPACENLYRQRTLEYIHHKDGKKA